MNPSRVRRDRLKELTDLPNVGPRIASTLFRLGIDRPADLRGRDGFEMYQALCELDARRHDPCVLDVFISITRFMNGEAPRSWWSFTAERKQAYPGI